MSSRKKRGRAKSGFKEIGFQTEPMFARLPSSKSTTFELKNSANKSLLLQSKLKHKFIFSEAFYVVKTIALFRKYITQLTGARFFIYKL